MSSLDRRGKYSYSYRDSYYKSSYSGDRDRADYHDRDRSRRDTNTKLKRSRSKDRFERPPLLDAPAEGSSGTRETRSKFTTFRDSTIGGSAYDNYDSSFRDDRGGSDNYRSSRFDETRKDSEQFNNFREDREKPYNHYKDSDRESYRRHREEGQFDNYRRDTFSPDRSFKRPLAEEPAYTSSTHPPHAEDTFTNYRQRDYDLSASESNLNWREIPQDNYPNNDYSSPKNQINIDESYLNINQREKDVAGDIPEFNPESSKLTSRQWLQVIDEVGARNENCNGEKKKFWFASKLAGSAKGFLNFGNIMQEKWFVIKKQFIKTYPSDMDYHNMLAEMMTIVQKENENLLTYFNAKLAAIKLCEISGKKSVSLLIGGLYDKVLRNRAFNHNFDTPDELFSFLNQSTKDKTTNDTKTPATFEQKQEFFKDNGSNCYICGLRNHTSDNCDTRKLCSKKEKELLYTQDIIFKTISCPKYMVDVKVNGRYLRGYADMESDEVTLTEEAAESLKITFTKMFNYYVRCFGSNYVRAVGETEVLIRVQKVAVTMKVYIVSNNDQAFPVVIGKAFTLQPSVRLDISEYQIEFYERDGPVMKSSSAKAEYRDEPLPGLQTKKFRKDESYNRPPAPKKRKGKPSTLKRRVKKKQTVARVAIKKDLPMDSKTVVTSMKTERD